MLIIITDSWYTIYMMKKSNKYQNLTSLTLATSILHIAIRKSFSELNPDFHGFTLWSLIVWNRKYAPILPSPSNPIYRNPHIHTNNWIWRIFWSARFQDLKHITIQEMSSLLSLFNASDVSCLAALWGSLVFLAISTTSWFDITYILSLH